MVNVGAKKSKRADKDMAAAVAFDRVGSKVSNEHTLLLHFPHSLGLFRRDAR